MQPFEKELLKNNSYFVDTPELNNEVESIIALEETNREALLIYSLAPVGKNFAFRNALSKKEGHKIFINFNDLSYMSSFPAYYVVKTIYDKLDEFGIAHQGDFPNTPPSKYQLDVETNYDVMLGALKRDLYCLKLDEPLYILISNCDMAFDNDFSLTFYRHFIFDKRELPQNLHVFLITSDNTQIETNKEYLTTVSLEGNKDNPKLFFKELMAKYDRKVNDELLLLANPSLRISDYVYIAGYIVNYADPKNYDEALKAILAKNNTDEILLAVFNSFYEPLSKFGKVVFAEALLDLYMFNFGLTKEQILSSGKYLFAAKDENEKLKDYEEISRKEKELILSSLEFFTKLEDDRLVIADKIIKEFIGTNAMYFTKLIVDSYQDRLYNAIEHLYQNREYIEKINYRYISEEYMGNPTYKLYKDVYLRNLEDNEVFSKKNIARYAIFTPLINRLREYINNFLVVATNFDREAINEKEILMISYIERASVVYQSGLDYGAFYAIFENKDLMYMLIAKSRRLVRRILNRFIDTQFDYHKKVDGGKGDISSSLGSLLAAEFSYLTDDRDDNELREWLLVLLGEVMDENGILINGNVKDAYLDYNVDPVTDFALVTAFNEDPLKDLNYLVEALREKELDFEALNANLLLCSNSYQNNDNVFHKLIYAYLALKTYMVLGENRKVTPQLSALLDPIMEDVLIYTEYCYFPEVYGAIYALFGRMYPKDYLERMIIGTHFLISQGYKKTTDIFVKAIKYFSSLRIKEGE